VGLGSALRRRFPIDNKERCFLKSAYRFSNPIQTWKMEITVKRKNGNLQFWVKNKIVVANSKKLHF